MKVFGLILAGGKSERFGSDKLACHLGNETVLERSIRILTECKCCDAVFTVRDGETRFESMRSGVDEVLKNVQADDYEKTFVLVHNSANPGVTSPEIEACIECAKSHGGCGVAHKIKDTVRRLWTEESGNAEIKFELLNRENLYAMQTPQCIRLDLLLRGIEFVKNHNAQNPENPILPTDDLQILDLINRNCKGKIAYTIIPASETNFKITTKDNLKKMRAVLGFGNIVGVGQDSHEFSPQGFLTLGGIVLKDFPKLKANSDGDVILHALFNAVSSALGRGSIGQTADKMCAEGTKDSVKYLDVILEEMQNRGYEIGNISISLTCKKPKVDKIEKVLKKSLGEILNIKTTLIGITATSGEGLYNENTVACTCNVTLI